MIKIRLPYDRFALVDDQDYDVVKNLRWRAQNTSQFRRKQYYVLATIKDPTKRNGHSTISMHRLILQPLKGEFVSFLNKNGLDCRRENMVIRSKQEIIHAARPHEGKRFKGVWRVKKATGRKGGRCWEVRIRWKGKSTVIGNTHTEEDGAKLYDYVARKIYGPNTYLNFPKYEMLEYVPEPSDYIYNEPEILKFVAPSGTNPLDTQFCRICGQPKKS